MDLRSENYELRNPPDGTSSFLTLPSSFLNAGLPLTSAASRPATETQGPTAQLQKLVAGRGINTTKPGLQVGVAGFVGRFCETPSDWRLTQTPYNTIGT